MEQKRTDRLDFILHSIQTNFNFLEEDYGYCMSSEDVESQLFMEVFDVLFTNVKRSRKVTISYVKSMQEGKEKFSFSASIVRLPYSSIQDFFSFDIFLNSKDVKLNTIINHFNESEVNDILKEMSISLRTYVSDIIDGSKWLSDFYPKWN